MNENLVSNLSLTKEELDWLWTLTKEYNLDNLTLTVATT